MDLSVLNGYQIALVIHFKTSVPHEETQAKSPIHHPVRAAALARDDSAGDSHAKTLKLELRAGDTSGLGCSGVIRVSAWPGPTLEPAGPGPAFRAAGA
jgi:hypothetical protein